MADAEVLALLAHIKDIGERTEKKLDDHIERDEKITGEFVVPLWNNFQQRKGAAALATALYTVVAGGVATAVSLFLRSKGS